ncbi:sulfate adenylyltransferase subunit CysD [Terricaulis silvestris]|uniref:Sulfate adenylyltransferase subunit 2 n=1 Tax=Terricaulis silvestris TaxID=2686094 RepID=A0A6I6MUW2_9CAUL|nr:sulfate adenylyltransferase subunit CysD [Terricaulis silvestris]QGZ96234.1 Sulfate adenylyltransferase subunit 2 [Terricaulis silvestris]
MRPAHKFDDALMAGAGVLNEAPAAARLARLEAEAIYILRELSLFVRPALLFSGGKDSAVLLHLAMKAFAPVKPPFKLLHVDTGHNFAEVLSFRDTRAKETGLPLIVRSVEDSIRRGSVQVAEDASRNAAQAVTLLEAQQEFEFDALIGGARRDEEKARAKERVFSHRDTFGSWRPRAQRPELWGLYNGRLGVGEHMRVFPLSNWTEADVWRYIAQEAIALPSLYYAHPRNVIRRDGLLFPVTELTPAAEGDAIEHVSVRFRTVGDVTCTCPVESEARTPEEVLTETLAATVSERGATRMDDRANAAAMERRKIEGYF